MRIRVSTIQYLSFVLLVWGGCAIFNSTLPANTAGIKAAAIGQFVVFILLYIAFGKVQGELFSIYAIWLIAFYLFQNGQILLYSLGFDYNYWYVERYSKKIVFQSVCISANSLCAAFAAGGFALKKERPTLFTHHLNCIDESVVQQTAKIGWIISGIVAYINVLIKMSIVLAAGYSGVLAYETTVPAAIGLVEYFFPVFTIMIIVYKNYGRFVNGVVGGFLLWGILTALTGDRTSGVAVVVLVAVMYMKNIYFFRAGLFAEKQRNSQRKRYLVFAAVAIVAMYLIAFAFSFRAGNQYEGFSLIDIVIRTIGELGFSFFPLVLNMQVYPSIEPYLYGKSLAASAICGFIPETIDFIGVTKKLSELAAAPMKKLQEYFSYNYGLDCSLIAEGYANFGNYAWIAVFISCSVVARMLSKVDYRRKDNRFSQYVGMALLYTWFTLPRRRSYYIYNHIFWTCLIMGIFLKAINDSFARKKLKIKE